MHVCFVAEHPGRLVSPEVESSGLSSGSVRRISGWCAVVLFLALTTLVGARVSLRLPDPVSREVEGHSLIDFRDAVYFPVVALFDGNNPYDAAVFMKSYPVGQPFFGYSPSTLALHAPFGLVPLTSARIAYWLASVVLLVVFAAAVVKLCDATADSARVFGLASLMTVAYPSYINSISGQVTLQAVLASIVAVQFSRNRPWLAGAALAVATFKPSYGVPVAILLLCRRDVRTVTIGAVLGGLGALIPSVFLARASGGWRDFTAVLVDNLMVSDVQDPMVALTRLDIPSTLARIPGLPAGVTTNIAVLVACLALAGLLLWRMSPGAQGTGVNSASGIVIVTTTLSCVFHNTYDAMFLFVPLGAVLVGRKIPWDHVRPVVRWGLAAALIVPLVNWIPSETVWNLMGVDGARTGLGDSINRIAVLLAWLVSLIAGARVTAKNNHYE